MVRQRATRAPLPRRCGRCFLSPRCARLGRLPPALRWGCSPRPIAPAEQDRLGLPPEGCQILAARQQHLRARGSQARAVERPERNRPLGIGGFVEGGRRSPSDLAAVRLLLFLQRCHLGTLADAPRVAWSTQDGQRRDHAARQRQRTQIGPAEDRFRGCWRSPDRNLDALSRAARLRQATPYRRLRPRGGFLDLLGPRRLSAAHPPEPRNLQLRGQETPEAILCRLQQALHGIGALSAPAGLHGLRELAQSLQPRRRDEQHLCAWRRRSSARCLARAFGQ